jgi:hypothetical protein
MKNKLEYDNIFSVINSDPKEALKMQNESDQAIRERKYSKTKTSYYRRLYIAYLIDMGINTVPLLLETTEMPKRTLQDTILALAEMDIVCATTGGTKNRIYSIEEWGAINKSYIKNNLKHIKGVLQSVRVK